jgi:hypothetical protein
MKNIWLQSTDVGERMDDEELLLQSYYVGSKADGLTKQLTQRIQEIVTAFVNEFWQADLFTDSPDYRQHMMHWKDHVEQAAIAHEYYWVASRYNRDEDGNLLEFIMLDILDYIKYKNEWYTDLFYGSEVLTDFGIACDCEVCK